MATKNSKGKRIAVIGAGAEPGNRCGPSPVYQGLETNVPRNLMTFSDLQWPTSVSLFPQSSQVNEYLHTYAAELRASYPNNDDLTVHCNTEVLKLRKGTHNTMPQWKIEAEAHHFGHAPDCEKLHFDGVVVAIGNYHKDFVPQGTPGFDDWAKSLPSSVLHSVRYRSADDFKNKTVLIVGNSASGWDISAQVAAVAKRVIVSTRRYDVRLGTAQVSPGSEAAPGVHCFDPATRSVRFTDGRVETGIDYIIFCTGYVYDFAFIKEGTGKKEKVLFEQGLQVKNVYKHLFYTKDPSLAFVGLPTMGASFTVAEAQSAVIARVFSQRLDVPCLPFCKAWESQHRETWLYQMQAGLATQSGYHSFQLRQDKDYVNELLEWSLEAILKQGVHGLAPVYWCECFDKARTETRAVRNAFKAKGDRRHEFTTPASLGFRRLRGPCASGIDLAYQTQRRCRSCFIFE